MSFSDRARTRISLQTSYFFFAFTPSSFARNRTILAINAGGAKCTIF